jgi:prepilin-type N-terminal cleavage/methylation domain-containing protein
MNRSTRGFTLIEIAIVLVIIGLIVGGVLVGRDMIAAAAVRAQISQIEKFNTAVNTFRDKYGYLPGDIPAGPAAQFGFAARGQYAGEGDGNGVIEGINTNAAGSNIGTGEGVGETGLFWVDLSTAGLIDATFNTATCCTLPPQTTLTTTPSLNAYLPQAKIGNGNYVYVWSGGGTPYDGINYFGLSAVTQLNSAGWIASSAGITVAQAYNIDTKIDDGLPQSGRVEALYLQQHFTLAWIGQIPGHGMTGSSTTCYDNGGAGSNPMYYSMAQNGGAGVNCTLTFRFQ